MSPPFASMHHTLYDHQNPLSLDTKHQHASHAFFDDASRGHGLDDSSMLDHSCGGPDSSLDMSPNLVASSRRESLALGGTPIFEAEDWHSVDMQSMPSNNPFFAATAVATNPFMNVHQHHHQSHATGAAVSYGDAAAAWAFPNLEVGAGGDFDASSVLRSSMPISMGPGNSMFSMSQEQQQQQQQQHQHQQHQHQQHQHQQQQQHQNQHQHQQQRRPSSPSMTIVDPVVVESSGNVGGGSKLPSSSSSRQHNPPSPAIRAHRDGIRKKNARFDIPPERTLNNIDQLISEAKTDKDMRDLKAQKRLLRNRQAALDSRQRKKQHTERLEDEKKQFTALIGEMEEEMNELRSQMELMFREKQEYAECINRLTAARDDMIVAHTNETGELRKKIAVLSDHVRRLEPGAGAPAQVGGSSSSSDCAGADFAGMYSAGSQMDDDMTIGGPWDHHHAGTVFYQPTADAQPDEVVEDIKQETPSQMSVVPTKKTDGAAADVKTPPNGGLLFMLFLVGAFVLSSRSTPSIPRVSEDVRAASESLLDRVLKDAGIQQPQLQQPQQPQGQAHVMSMAASQPSGTVGWSSASSSGPAMPSMSASAGAGVDTVTPSMLGELGDSLTRPTQEQSNEQIFSLTEAQYNGMHSQDFFQQDQRYQAQAQAQAQAQVQNQGGGSAGRKTTLADALSAMRVTEKQDSAAQVYTRSLLWDQIPGDVVRNFAKMVSECNSAQ
ncbi:Chromosome segregation ATPase [Geosmithia morbida]|uniref:Chromosome segregation ATPase n=1 Tax=Geosmithia morbida TaxID=1094350 RepID=A0A9P5D2K8_9HYPO|nr:Chromosome segregation ATPase [Geosmithia morbida]KAF4123977.1 Chromosome segregation ATPase [Geosmithia morbida]